MTERLTAEEQEVTHCIIGASIEIHRALGPGLLESAYEECLSYELAERGLQVERQPGRPVVYKAVKLAVAYRPDLVVERKVVVELKTVERLIPVHTAQLLTYFEARGATRRIASKLQFSPADERHPTSRTLSPRPPKNVVLRDLRVLRGRFLFSEDSAGARDRSRAPETSSPHVPFPPPWRQPRSIAAARSVSRCDIRNLQRLRADGLPGARAP